MRPLLFVFCLVQFSAAVDWGAMPWPCKKLSCPGPTPTSVHKLRPCDIRYMMAMGDSITAAAVAKPLNDGPYEFRGLSYAIGEDANVTTLPNILKEYSPSIIGGSVKAHIPEMHGWSHLPFEAEDRLNGAQSGAVVQDLPGTSGGAQVDYLISSVKRLKVNMDEWKVLTIWIGANNLCGSCETKHAHTSTPEYFQAQLNETLFRVKQNFPKTFVNLVSFFNLSQVYEIDKHYPYCEAVHDLFTECSCMFNLGDKGRLEMDTRSQQYNAVMANISKMYNSPDDDSFAVVFQPFLMKSQVPDRAFLSAVDCFHPSAEAHAAIAKLLWNSMITPIPQKPEKVTMNDPVKCADETSLLYTS